MARTKPKEHEYGFSDVETIKSPRFDWSYVIIVIILSLIACSLTTQEMAKLYDYHSALGKPIYANWYKPWDCIVWYVKFSDASSQHYYLDSAERNLRIIGLIIMFLSLYKLVMKNQSGEIHPNLHGSACFAKYKDIVRARLIQRKGFGGLLDRSIDELFGRVRKKGEYIVLGQWTDPKTHKKYMLKHNGPQHILLAAPTGRGKGVSIILPTLVSWTQSVIVYDLKGENFGMTSAWRKQHANNHVLRFAPASNDGTSTRYNCLQEIRINTGHDVQDAQNIAEILMDTVVDGKKGDDYFSNAAKPLLAACILHVCYTQHRLGRIATLTDVVELLLGDEGFSGAIVKIGDGKHVPFDPPRKQIRNGRMVEELTTHSYCRSQANSILSLQKGEAGRQIAGIQGEMETKLTLYLDPIISKNINGSDFRISDLMDHEKPVSLYICVGVQDQERLTPLTKLLFTQVMSILAADMEFEGGKQSNAHKHKLLMLIDEFPSLGKMKVFNKAIAYLRGFGIKCMIVIQDFSQLRAQDAYGRDEAITPNCGIRVFFKPNTISTAEEISKSLGTTTVTYNSASKGLGGKLLANKGGNLSSNSISRALLTPGEVMDMQEIDTENPHKPIPGEMLIFGAAKFAIKAVQSLFFLHPIFKPRIELGAVDKTYPIPPPLEEKADEFDDYPSDDFTDFTHRNAA